MARNWWLTPDESGDGHVLDCPVWDDGDCSDVCGAWRADPDHARDAAISDHLREVS